MLDRLAGRVLGTTIKVTLDIVGTGIFGAILFLLPQGRTEQVVVTIGLLLWLGRLGDQLQKAQLESARWQFTLQTLRTVLARFALHDQQSYETIEQGFRLMQEQHVSLDERLASRHERYLRPVPLGALRIEVEQTWCDYIIPLERSQTYAWVDVAFYSTKWLMLAVAALSLF